MFKDYADERRDKLARVLYALATGIDELKKYVINPFFLFLKPSNRSINQDSPSSLTTFPPLIYGSWILYNPPSSARLVFTSKLESLDSNRLLFTGSLSGSSFAEPIPVLVKLVNAGYGVDVHHLLSTTSHQPYTPTQRSKALREHTSWNISTLHLGSPCLVFHHIPILQPQSYSR